MMGFAPCGTTCESVNRASAVSFCNREAWAGVSSAETPLMMGSSWVTRPPTRRTAAAADTALWDSTMYPLRAGVAPALAAMNTAASATNAPAAPLTRLPAVLTVVSESELPRFSDARYFSGTALQSECLHRPLSARLVRPRSHNRGLNCDGIPHRPDRAGTDGARCYEVLQMLRCRMQSRIITQRELRNQSAAILREVEAG